MFTNGPDIIAPPLTHISSSVERTATMTLRVTLSNDVADYLERQSQALNKPCDQIADELLRRVISSEAEAMGAAIKDGSGDSELTGDCLNQTLDELYVDDYFKKMRR